MGELIETSWIGPFGAFGGDLGRLRPSDRILRHAIAGGLNYYRELVGPAPVPHAAFRFNPGKEWPVWNLRVPDEASYKLYLRYEGETHELPTPRRR